MSYNRKKKEVAIKQHALKEGEREILAEENERKKRPCLNCLHVNVVVLTLVFYLVLSILFIATYLV